MVLVQNFYGFFGSPTLGHVAFATGTGKECRGSRVASYSATPEGDGLNLIKSISAMPHYKDTTHEELRLEDYELCKGSSFPIQNQGNAFQQSNSSLSPFGFGSGPFGTETAALVSNSSVKTPFGSTSTGFGVSSTNMFSSTNNSGFGFNSRPATLPSISAHGSTSSTFGISNMPPFAPSSSSSGFGTSPFGFGFNSRPATLPSISTHGSTSSIFAPSSSSRGFGTSTFGFPTPSASVGEGPSISPFKVSTTPGFGITSTPSTLLSWSTSPSAYNFSSGPKSKCNTVAPSTSNNPSGSSFVFQTSSGSQCTTSTTYQASGVAYYSATWEVDRSDTVTGGRIQSISAMPSYKDISHEELRSENYEEGGNFSSSCWQTSDAPSNIFRSAPLSNQSSVHFPFRSCKSSFFGPNMPPIAPSSSSSGFGTSTFGFPTPSASAGDGPSISPFKVSTTPGFDIASTPLSWSNLPSAYNFSSGPKSTCNTVAPSTSNNTSGFSFGFQTSSGSQGTTSTTYQGSGVVCYLPTGEVDMSNNTFTGMRIQSISAMTSYKDKSHEELRSEDYGLHNKGGKFSSSSRESSNAPSNIFRSAPLSNPFSVNSPFYPFKSSSFEPNRENIMSPSNTISTAPTLFPSVNPLCFTDLNHSQSQAFTPQPTTASFMPTFTPQPTTAFTPQPTTPSLIPSTDPMLKNSCECPKISTTFTSTSAPLSNQPSVRSPFQPFKFSFITPGNTISTAPTFSPPANPLCCTHVCRSQSQAFTLQPATASFMPTFTPNLNPPSFIVSPPVQSTSVTSSVPWPSIVKAPQPQQTAEKVGSLSANDLNKPSQAASGLPTVEFTSQNITGQQYVPSSTLSMQSSLVVNPFATRFPINQPNSATSRRHGISSLPVSNNLSSNRTASFLRIRHVSSRQPGLPTQKPNGRSSETKVPFFIDEEDRPDPVAPFLPRENPIDWLKISSPVRSPQESKGDEVEDNSISFKLDENSTRLTDDTATQHEHMSAPLNQHQDDVAARTERRGADHVLALLPKLPNREYYTEPSLHELAAKEMEEPGWCSHVKEFVVGRQSYGSIKFLGETDVRHLDIKSIVQLNNREVVVYPDGRKKPGVGQELNKPAEVTLLNVKCINNKTGKQYVEGHQVESYQEMLMKMALKQEAEFVSYDPVEGEWKFRVQHF